MNNIELDTIKLEKPIYMESKSIETESENLIDKAKKFNRLKM
jgi:hypothetical protein